MNTKLIPAALVLTLALPALCLRTQAEQFTPRQLIERAIHRRAVEAVVWGIPAVNYEPIQRAPRRYRARELRKPSEKRFLIIFIAHNTWYW